jgi:hypothetical protein
MARMTGMRSNEKDTRQPRKATRVGVVRVYDEAGNVIETHEQAGGFKEW